MGRHDRNRGRHVTRDRRVRALRLLLRVQREHLALLWQRHMRIALQLERGRAYPANVSAHEPEYEVTVTRNWQDNLGWSVRARTTDAINPIDPLAARAWTLDVRFSELARLRRVLSEIVGTPGTVVMLDGAAWYIRRADHHTPSGVDAVEVLQHGL
jgi:hypothetical protein